MRWSTALETAPLRQPDQRSCGASVAVAAAALHHDGRPPVAGPELDRQVLLTHRRLTARTDLLGEAQWPWPRFWGTPPWALARHLTATSGVRHRVQVVRRSPARGVEPVRAALAAGLPAALYLGSATMPRHVVLALPPQVGDSTPDRWAVYDPAPGRVRHLGVDRWTSGTVDECAWPVPWAVVAPEVTTR
ncbi:hypothetical protein [Nocardioides jishulii]|uniref:Peptidase C39-like domain-containing protein n=1 Tax=Nocardioides jishulii TaxID=2575440 RepID=A0A4U2YTG5_9ACTN|nr:hypothetical protein [Nocardioides jishulii]QCX28281.1 hypothetical protein FCL41_12685 [Nocardioides jishulii]TKI64826.1 hypothetical protein FC770_06885 [Nocardioides jishulii]